MRPSGRREIEPSSRLGRRAASRGMGRRLFTSEVTRALEWISFNDCQPPEVVVAPMMPIACTVELKPTVIVFVPVRGGCSDRAVLLLLLGGGVAAGGAAHASKVRDR